MTAWRLTFKRAARSSRARNIPSVRSTFTRRIGLTTLNRLVKNEDTSSPWDANHRATRSRVETEAHGLYNCYIIREAAGFQSYRWLTTFGRPLGTRGMERRRWPVAE